MSVCVYVCMSVCMVRLGEWMNGFAQIGEVQGSVSYIPNNYFFVLDMTNAKNKEIFFEGKISLKLHSKLSY